MKVGLDAFLLLAAALFSIGMYGAISKKSTIGVLMSLEIMSIAITLNLVAIDRFVTPAAIVIYRPKCGRSAVTRKLWNAFCSMKGMSAMRMTRP